jgi:YhcH/YjgK/YiaL family protein
MILDTLDRSGRYRTMHPDFARAFEFLARPDLAALAPGRHAIDGERLYVSMDVKPGRGRDGARLEAHRRYIDIQFTIAGTDEIGWTPLESCAHPAGPHDENRDIRFFDDRPDTWLLVPPGRFAIFFPDDAHAPLGGEGEIRKAIVKVAVP